MNLLLLLALALAADPAVTPTPEAPVEVAPSAAAGDEPTTPSTKEETGSCAAPLSVYIEEVQTAGNRIAYHCLADRDDASEALLAALSELKSEAVGEERIQRALAVHLLQRLDRPLRVTEVRALGAADRRLLADGVYARRGRRSPSPEHELIFGQFDWYTPSASFNNGSLLPVDRENIKMLDDPPRPAKAANEGSAAEVIAEAGGKAAAPSPCSCASAGPSGLGWIGALLLLSARRRRGTNSLAKDASAASPSTSSSPIQTKTASSRRPQPSCS